VQEVEVFHRLAVDMDIHGYIHVWISNLSHPVDVYIHGYYAGSPAD